MVVSRLVLHPHASPLVVPSTIRKKKRKRRLARTVKKRKRRLLPLERRLVPSLWAKKGQPKTVMTRMKKKRKVAVISRLPLQKDANQPRPKIPTKDHRQEGLNELLPLPRKVRVFVSEYLLPKVFVLFPICSQESRKRRRRRGRRGRGGRRCRQQSCGWCLHRRESLKLRAFSHSQQCCHQFFSTILSFLS